METLSLLRVLPLLHEALDGLRSLVWRQRGVAAALLRALQAHRRRQLQHQRQQAHIQPAALSVPPCQLQPVRALGHAEVAAVDDHAVASSQRSAARRLARPAVAQLVLADDPPAFLLELRCKRALPCMGGVMGAAAQGSATLPVLLPSAPGVTALRHATYARARLPTALASC
jgi:hypothetical protein